MKWKTENDTFECYQFGSNLGSESCMRKQIFWAMGESGHSFDLEFKENQKKKKNLIKKA